MVALPKRQMCYWPAKTRQKLDFFQIHTSLGPGAQKLLKYKWIKLNTASFHFPCVGEKSWIVCSNEFFSYLFQVLCWSFSYCTFTGTFAIGFQKWFYHEWIDFGLIRWEMAFLVDFISAWTEICMNCSSVFFFWRHQIFSMVNLRGILVCSIKVPILFSYRIF